MSQKKANYNISHISRLLKVSRSVHYKWAYQQNNKAAGNDPREQFVKELDEKIWESWKA